ncbi:hypothetical protein HK096_006324, partial [Nowakowskiella sp. JEL0078]
MVSGNLVVVRITSGDSAAPAAGRNIQPRAEAATPVELSCTLNGAAYGATFTQNSSLVTLHSPSRESLAVCLPFSVHHAFACSHGLLFLAAGVAASLPFLFSLDSHLELPSPVALVSNSSVSPYVDHHCNFIFVEDDFAIAYNELLKALQIFLLVPISQNHLFKWPEIIQNKDSFDSAFKLKSAEKLKSPASKIRRSLSGRDDMLILSKSSPSLLDPTTTDPFDPN